MKKTLFTFLICNLHYLFCIAQDLNVTLASQLSYGSQNLSNICGWVDTTDGKEYALVGGGYGLSVVDVSNPSAPVEIVQIPGPHSIWREIKTNGNYAYVTTEAGGGLQIVDLGNLPATNLATAIWAPVINGTTLSSIHALHIDNGKVYLYGSNIDNRGAIIADITTNPMAPIYLGSYDNRYIHDGYVRNDTMYACHILDGDCEIVDVSNPAAGVSLGDVQTPGLFTHNSWLTKNSKIVLTTDEIPNSFLTAYDISNLNNISELDRIQSNPGSQSVVHNTHIIQKNGVDYAVTSWYDDGFTIVDLTRPGNLVQVGNYDTSPSTSGSNEEHCWGVYPFLPSGTIVASDMQDGLFVLTPNYVRACYLEGMVVNCSTGSPVSGVKVVIQLANPQSNAHVDITDAAGQYAVGVAVPDTYLVVSSKLGFMTDTDTVILSPGVVKIDTIKICKLPLFSYSGHIFDNVTTAGIPNADVSIYNGNIKWDTVADANGNFTIPTMFTGTYTIASGKWGYVTKCTSGQNITPSSGIFNMGLDKGIYDDFAWNFGWKVSGNATQGKWERGEPLGTYKNSTPINPEYDVTNDCSDEAFVTGNTGLTVSDDDVDSGSTVLTSPVFDLSGYVEPYIFYSRWKNFSSGSTDTIIVKINNGTTTATLENIFTSSSGQSQWGNRHYKISSLLVPTANMTFSMQASDLGNDDNIEAGLDKFYILDSTKNSVEEIIHKVNITVYPNPFATSATVEVLDPVNTNDLKLQVFDVFGKIVLSFPIHNPKFQIQRNGLPAGIYLFRITHADTVLSTGKLCVE